MRPVHLDGRPAMFHRIYRCRYDMSMITSDDILSTQLVEVYQSRHFA